jgi:hypothetical protein
MAAVAVLGAVAAYRAAVAEDDASVQARTLEQGQLLALTYRQDYLNDIAEWHHFAADEHRLNVEADQLRQRARRLYSTDVFAAQKLNIEAQTDSTVAQTLAPYLSYFYVGTDPELGYESNLDKRVAIHLGRLGFPVTWNEDNAARGGEDGFDIWRTFRHAVAARYDRVWQISLMVVVLVFSLFLFTLADLAVKRRSMAIAVGTFCSISAAAALIVIDPDAWLMITIPPIIIGAVGLWVLRRFSPREAPGKPHEEPVENEPPEVEPQHFAGAQVHLRLADDRFTRSVVLAIAVTAVLSTASGLGYAIANGRADSVVDQAFADEAAMSQASSRLRAQLDDSLNTLATYQELTARERVARVYKKLRTDGIAESNPRDAIISAVVTADVTLAWLRANPSVKKTIVDHMSPKYDPYFPQGLASEYTVFHTWYFYALWDAENLTGTAWRARAAAYLAILSLFAIALYLFGQALAMRSDPASYLLAIFAAALTFTGVAYGATTALKRISGNVVGGTSLHTVRLPKSCRTGQPPPAQTSADSDSAAALYFGCAQLLASVSHDASHMAQAVVEYRRAIQARPDFAFAQAGYASSLILASTPQAPDEYPSLLTQTLKDATTIVRAEQKAFDVATQQRLDSPGMLTNLSFYLYLHGLLQPSVAELTESVKRSGEAMRAFARYQEFASDPYYIGLLARLARGQFDLARQMYGNPGKYANDLASDRAAAAGAFSDLELLKTECRNVQNATNCKKLDQLMPELRADIVRAAWPPRHSASRIAVTITDAHVEPGGVRWRAKISGFDPAVDQLVAVWYRFIPSWRTWSAVSDISGRASPEKDNSRKESFSFRTSYLAASEFHGCLAGGDYRADFYVNGSLATSRVFFDAYQNYRPVVLHDINLALCLPRKWVVSRSPLAARSIDSTSLAAPDSGDSVSLARWFNPFGRDFTRFGVVLRLENPRVQDIGFGSKACGAGTSGDTDVVSDRGRTAIRRAWLGENDVGYQAIVVIRDLHASCVIADWIENALGEP